MSERPTHLVVFYHRYSQALMGILTTGPWTLDDGTPRKHPWRMYQDLDDRRYNPGTYDREAVYRMLRRFQTLRYQGGLWRRLKESGWFPRDVTEYAAVPLTDLGFTLT